MVPWHHSCSKISKPLNLRGNPKAYQHIRADAQKEFEDKLNASMSAALKGHVSM
jgi:hypothetical protein